MTANQGPRQRSIISKLRHEAASLKSGLRQQTVLIDFHSKAFDRAVAERDSARAEASAAKWERDDWRTRATAAAVVEREACALVAESFDVRVVDPLGRVHIATSGLEAIATAIRARSK